MKLSSILHKYINEGRHGCTDSLNATPVELNDEQLGELWSKATLLESALAGLQHDMKVVANRKLFLE